MRESQVAVQRDTVVGTSMMASSLSPRECYLVIHTVYKKAKEKLKLKLRMEKEVRLFK